jgi:hypothetical protein
LTSSDSSTSTTTAASADKVVPLASYQPSQAPAELEEMPQEDSSNVTLVTEPEERNLDEIPF